MRSSASQPRSARKRRADAWTSSAAPLLRRARCCSAWTSNACRPRELAEAKKDDRPGCACRCRWFAPRRDSGPQRAGRPHRFCAPRCASRCAKGGDNHRAGARRAPASCIRRWSCCATSRAQCEPVFADCFFLHFSIAITKRPRNRVNMFVSGCTTTNQRSPGCGRWLMAWKKKKIAETFRDKTGSHRARDVGTARRKKAGGCTRRARPGAPARLMSRFAQRLAAAWRAGSMRPAARSGPDLLVSETIGSGRRSRANHLFRLGGAPRPTCCPKSMPLQHLARRRK